MLVFEFDDRGPQAVGIGHLVVDLPDVGRAGRIVFGTAYGAVGMSGPACAARQSARIKRVDGERVVRAGVGDGCVGGLGRFGGELEFVGEGEAEGLAGAG